MPGKNYWQMQYERYSYQLVSWHPYVLLSYSTLPNESLHIAKSTFPLTDSITDCAAVSMKLLHLPHPLLLQGFPRLTYSHCRNLLVDIGGVPSATLRAKGRANILACGRRQEIARLHLIFHTADGGVQQTLHVTHTNYRAIKNRATMWWPERLYTASLHCSLSC